MKKTLVLLMAATCIITNANDAAEECQGAEQNCQALTDVSTMTEAEKKAKLLKQQENAEATETAEKTAEEVDADETGDVQ